MRLILASGSGYYPYTQKPVDYQPYRPVYLFRGPPPDAGFSYGLYEDEEAGKKYYADLGLDSFSPLSGRSSKLLEELSSDEVEKLLGEDLKSDNLKKRECSNCGGAYYDNFHLSLKGRDDFFCHHCGSKLKNEAPSEQEINDMSQPAAAASPSKTITNDPVVKEFIENGLKALLKSSQMKEASERLASRYGTTTDRAKQELLKALKEAIR